MKINQHDQRTYHPFGMSRPDFRGFLADKKCSMAHDKSLMKIIFRDLNPASHVLKSSTLPLKIKDEISKNFDFSLPYIHSAVVSPNDFSVKFLLNLEDSQQIETVLIPEKKRLTLCVSSQVGCMRACVFCATGRLGLIRNLSASEIVSQLLVVRKWMSENAAWQEGIKNRFDDLQYRFAVQNIVFMGMGEPLDNLDAVEQAVQVFKDSCGLGIGQKHLSVSTSGNIDSLYEFIEKHPRVPIAISLHAPNDQIRSKIMPITKQWPIASIIEFIQFREHSTKESLLIQYTLIKGVNDQDHHIEELATLLESFRVKVNLIPFNSVKGSRFESPSEERVLEIKDQLFQRGIRTMVRFSKGQDIYGACGQLKPDS